MAKFSAKVATMANGHGYIGAIAIGLGTLVYCDAFDTKESEQEKGI